MDNMGKIMDRTLTKMLKKRTSSELGKPPKKAMSASTRKFKSKRKKTNRMEKAARRKNR